jgi:DNA repair protein RecO (recombination protein O)
MSLFETEALILKSYSLAEADKIILLLTQNQGLIRGVAKGAKRLKSRFGGSLEPFSIVQIEYFQKEERELVSIRRIDLVKSYFENAGEINFLQKFSYLVELLIEFAPPHDPNERLYRMAKVCLETASKMPENLESIVVYFELWLLRLGGYLPDWRKCDRCKRELNGNESTGLQINFHLRCADCQKSRKEWQISPIQRKIFLTAQEFTPVKFSESTLKSENDLKEISRILRRIISQILGRELVGEKILTANL